MMRASSTVTMQDTASSAAYVTKPSGPPDNGAFMNGAYLVAIAIYTSYIVLLLRRMSAAKRVADGLSHSRR